MAEWLLFVGMIVAVLSFVTAVEVWGARTEHSLLAHFVCLAVGMLAIAWALDLTRQFTKAVFGP